MPDKTDILILAIRQALLAIIDALEVYRGMERTKDIRREWRDAIKNP